MSVFFFLWIGCAKNFALTGQLRDTNGRPVENAIVAVEAAKVETRSNKNGEFSLNVLYKKKNGPYAIDIKALAHKPKSQELFLETEKAREIKTKITLEPKVIFLPYRKINMDLGNPNPAYPPITISPPIEETKEAQEKTGDTTETKENRIQESSNTNDTVSTIETKKKAEEDVKEEDVKEEEEEEEK